MCTVVRGQTVCVCVSLIVPVDCSTFSMQVWYMLKAQWFTNHSTEAHLFVFLILFKICGQSSTYGGNEDARDPSLPWC